VALHRLTSVTIGVPNVAATSGYYTEFGLTPEADGWFRSRDAGRQMRIVHAPTRRLVEIRVGADDQDDINRVAANLARLGIEHQRSAGLLVSTEKATAVRAVLEVADRVTESAVPPTVYNGPGRIERVGQHAQALDRTDRVKPRRLGHAVLGTPDFPITKRFFADGLGFKVSDFIKNKGVFLRCSIDHHNLLIMSAPLSFLHHTSWQVDDVDDIGRGAFAMLEDHPERHVWGLGRHHAGSNFFWYLKDPAGNFSEYYSDMDCIIDDQLWTPEVLEGARGLFNWGPPPPPSFLHPEDLAALMTGSHSPR